METAYNPDIIKRALGTGGVARVVKLSGYNQRYVGECIADPVNFKGSSAAKKAILEAMEKVMAQNKEQQEQDHNRLMKLMNEAEKINEVA